VASEPLRTKRCGRGVDPGGLIFSDRRCLRFAGTTWRGSASAALVSRYAALNACDGANALWAGLPVSNMRRRGVRQQVRQVCSMRLTLPDGCRDADAIRRTCSFTGTNPAAIGRDQSKACAEPAKTPLFDTRACTGALDQPIPVHERLSGELGRRRYLRGILRCFAIHTRLPRMPCKGVSRALILSNIRAHRAPMSSQGAPLSQLFVLGVGPSRKNKKPQAGILRCFDDGFNIRYKTETSLYTIVTMDCVHP